MPPWASQLWHSFLQVTGLCLHKAIKSPTTAIFRASLPQSCPLPRLVYAMFLMSDGHSLISVPHKQQIPCTEKFAWLFFGGVGGGVFVLSRQMQMQFGLCFEEIPCLNLHGHQYGHSIDTWLLKETPSKTFHILFIPTDLTTRCFQVRPKNPPLYIFFLL